MQTTENKDSNKWANYMNPVQLDIDFVPEPSYKAEEGLKVWQVLVLIAVSMWLGYQLACFNFRTFVEENNLICEVEQYTTDKQSIYLMGYLNEKSKNLLIDKSL